VTRAALCAERGTTFARHPAATLTLKKRRRAEYRLPPHSISVRLARACRKGRKTRSRLAHPLYQRLRADFRPQRTVVVAFM